MIGAFAARLATLGRAQPAPLAPQRLLRHVCYRGYAQMPVSYHDRRHLVGSEILSSGLPLEQRDDPKPGNSQHTSHPARRRER